MAAGNLQSSEALDRVLLSSRGKILGWLSLALRHVLLTLILIFIFLSNETFTISIPLVWHGNHLKHL